MANDVQSLGDVLRCAREAQANAERAWIEAAHAKISVESIIARLERIIESAEETA